MTAPPSCLLDECSRPSAVRGYCRPDYRRLRKSGQLETRQIVGDDVGRFWSYVTITAAGCWLWRGAVSDTGYRGFWVKGKQKLAHRYAYQLLVGEIPKGLHLDHLSEAGCRHRNCVNPRHLEAVTQTENNRRAAARRKTIKKLEAAA